MSNDIKVDRRISTGVPSEEYKANYDRIFRPSLWRKRQDPILCGACGIDRTNGAMCYGCTKALGKTAWEPQVETMYSSSGEIISRKIKRTPDGEWQDLK